MSDPIQFSTYLHDRMTARRMGVDELTHEMHFASTAVVESWRNGWTRPEPEQLPKLAEVLGVDPFELAMGWLADRVPDLEQAIFDAVLTPRGSDFPHSSDLALRAPKRQPVVDRDNVEDPHDAPRKESAPSEERRIIRKVAVTTKPK